MRRNNGQSAAGVLAWTVVLGGLIAIAAVVLFWGFPQYSIWTAEMAGKAELARAEYSKRVAVETSKAKKDAASYEAAAEAVRKHRESNGYL